MSLLVVGVASALTLLFAGFSAEIAEVSTATTRAQAAADAAALAAMAESGPYGRGAYEAQARHYARANGARLLSCWCKPGARTVQVRVAVGGVVAEARAELDASALAPAAIVSAQGLHPVLAAAVDGIVAASHGRVRIVSGFRDSHEQARLWDRAVRRYGSPAAADDWVARPGTSMHERGLAVDLGGDLELAGRLIHELRLPLHRPLPHEPWHFELRTASPS